MKPALLFVFGAVCIAATSEETRGIVPEEVINARPAKTAAAAAPAPKYQATAPGAAIRRAEGRQIGVTIWRLRKASPADDGARILVQEESDTTSWIPERVSSSNRLRAGDRVRLAIESPEAGYLYVIDRERYASGERGAPYLVFPTTRTRGGDNKVTGGRLIDIPAQEDRPNFFTLHASRNDQVEEELTVMLSPKPLDGIAIRPRAIALPDAQAAAWEKQWGTKAEAFELSGGVGKPWTDAEQRAGADAARLLTQEDPAPQTVYRVEASRGTPLLVKVRLRYGATSRK